MELMVMSCTMEFFHQHMVYIEGPLNYEVYAEQPQQIQPSK